jgi:hypothetical protein
MKNIGFIISRFANDTMMISLARLAERSGLIKLVFKLSCRTPLNHMEIHVHVCPESMSSHLNSIHSTLVVHPRFSPFSFLLILSSCLVAGKADISDLNVRPTLPSYSVRFKPHPRALATVIRVNDLPLPSERIPAGFYVSINIDPKRRWKSPVRVVSSDKSDMLGDIVIL